MRIISNKEEYKVKEKNGCINNPYPFKLMQKVDNKPIFSTTILINSKIYEIVIKIMDYTKGSLLEKNIMVAIRDHIISKNNSKHFLLIYFYSLCLNGNYKFELRTYNEPVENSLRYLIMEDYELEKKKIDDNTFCNLLIQSLLSIGSYHNLTGYVHTDTHTGNFLCAKNSEHNPERYYKYILDGVTYYLKSCEYNVMIYDFGYSDKLNKIPKNTIKKIELLYQTGYIVARNYIYNGDLYNIVKQNDGSYILYEPYGDIINLTVKSGESYITIYDESFSYDDILEIYNMFKKIEENDNYYRIKILIDDYCIFLGDLRVFFLADEDVVENPVRLNIIDSIKVKIEKLKDYYVSLPLNDITDEVFYGYAKEIFKSVLDICITDFPNILTLDSPRNALNEQPFLLYQEDKIVVVEEVVDNAL